MRLDIDGILITSSPLHITDIDKARYLPGKTSFSQSDEENTPKGRIVYTKTPGSFPITLTRRQEVLLSSPIQTSRNDLWTLEYPVLPANGLRGALRRHAAAIIENHLVYDREEKLSFGAYNGLHIGAVTGNPDGLMSPREEARAAFDHPFMGLFGGGPRMIPSVLRVSTGVPLLERLIAINMVPDTMDQFSIPSIPDAQAWRLTQEVPVVRGDDALQMRDRRAPDVIQDYAAAMDRAQQEVMDRRARKDTDEQDEGGNGRQMLSYAQVVTPGTPFYVRFSMEATEAQGGLLLQALLNMIRSQEIKGIGGRSAIGYGRYLQKLRVRIDGEFEQPFQGQGDDCDWNPAATGTQALLEALNTRMESVTAAEIEGFFRSMKPTEEEKAAKKASKKAAAEPEVVA